MSLEDSVASITFKSMRAVDTYHQADNNMCIWLVLHDCAQCLLLVLDSKFELRLDRVHP